MGSKFGKCRLCPKKSPEVRIYGDGVCAYHLGHPGDDQSEADDGGEPAAVVTGGRGAGKTATLLNLFYEAQIARLPKCCENCGARLAGNPPGGLKSYIAHIVPKKHFKSVMFLPLNVWFACVPCHTDYDNSWSKASKMKIWPVAVERFKTFMDQIKDTELRHLPAILRDLTNR